MSVLTREFEGENMSAKAAAVKPGDVVAEGEAAGGGKKKKLLLIVAILVVVLIAGGGGAAYFLFFGKKKPKGHGKGGGEHAEANADAGHGEEEEADAEDADEDHGKAKPPVYVTLEPFTVNLAAEAADRYLQVGIDLKVAAPEVADKIKLHLPEVRNGILLILTAKRVDELGTLEGKNKLRTEIRDAVNKPIGMYKPAPEGADPSKWKPKKGAQDVLLTSFVIQ